MRLASAQILLTSRVKDVLLTVLVVKCQQMLVETFGPWVIGVMKQP
jgi:hypothetical protein